MTLGEKIQELRRRNAMSQDVLAEKLEVSRQAVSKWERDEAVPETDKIVRLAQVFSVSTDYLLMEEQQHPPQYRYQAPPRQTSFSGERLERFIRRHGYKGGYVLIAAGALLCVIALLFMIFMPRLGTGFFDSAGNFGNSWNSGIYMEGDVPQDVLDAIYDQAGSGMNMGSGGLFGDFEDEFQQQAGQMQSAWQSSVRTMAAMFAAPVMLFGIGLIVLGIIIIVEGKEIARKTA